MSEGNRLMDLVVDHGASVAEAPRLAGVSRKSAYRLLSRFREGGCAAHEAVHHALHGERAIQVQISMARVPWELLMWGFCLGRGRAELPSAARQLGGLRDRPRTPSVSPALRFGLPPPPRFAWGRMLLHLPPKLCFGRVWRSHTGYTHPSAARRLACAAERLS